MEGVGARLGRSSTRYGPATVFSGPVRKWKKRWVQVSPSSSSSSSINNNNNHAHHHHQQLNGASTTNGNNGSHLLLYKWTPLSQSNKDNNNGDKGSVKEDPADAPPPKRKFKYIPVYELEKQQKEAAEKEDAGIVSDEFKTSANPISVDTLKTKSDGFAEKPDINDVPMEESQDDNKVVRQDLNESTLDLSLGLNSCDDDSDKRPDEGRDGRLERVNSSMGT